MLALIRYRPGAGTDPAWAMGRMILHSLLLEQRTDDIEDIIPCRYAEITLPMLGAAFFERGWAPRSYLFIQPIDTFALGSICYVTEAGKFVVVDNVHHCLQAQSGPLSWDERLGFYSKAELEEIPGEGIVGKGGHMYHRRKQVYSSIQALLNL